MWVTIDKGIRELRFHFQDAVQYRKRRGKRMTTVGSIGKAIAAVGVIIVVSLVMNATSPEYSQRGVT